MLIELSKEDAHSAQLMGADTVKICEMQGFPPRLENERQSREEANVCGFKAEFAVCRLFNLSAPTFNILTDGGVDLWWNDCSIDVKWTGKEYGPLIFDSMDKFQAKIAVLVGSTDNPSVMRVNGWMDRKTFKEESTEHDFGYGMRLTMKVSQLYPIESLWRFMMQRSLGPKNWRDYDYKNIA